MTENAAPLPSTHLILVSDQPVPSLGPLLDPALAAKHAILAATPARLQHAQWLADSLVQAELSTEILLLERPYDLEALRSIFQGLIDRFGSIAGNVTGGNKLMSIAAYETLAAAGQPVYYINIEKDGLQWLHTVHQPDHSLHMEISMEQYLQAWGIRASNLSRKQPYSRPWLEIAHACQKSGRYQNTFRRIRSIANHHDNHASMDLSYIPSSIFQQLAASGLLKGPPEAAKFVNADARAFISGGWLEGLTFEILQRFRRQGLVLQDLVINLKVEHEAEQEPVLNEMDVAFLYRNTLFLLECKTGNTSNGKTDELDRVILMLARSRDRMGGLRGKAALISQVPLKPRQRSRCADTGISTLQGIDGLRQLESWLREWLDTVPGQCMNPT